MKKILFILSILLLNDKIWANNQLSRYLQNIDNVQGWFDKGFIDILVRLDSFQTTWQIQGNVAEIGVFFGKSFIPLYLLTKPFELALAIDVFENQQYNYDGSGGYCTYPKFIENMKKFSTDLSRLKVIKGDSSKKTAEDYVRATNNKGFRLFSIDGCHRAQETVIDLENAVKVLSPAGVIIVDDYFNKDWPGVSEGVNRFLLAHDNIKPFFIGFNKVLLAEKTYIANYTAFLKASLKPKKESLLFGSTVLIYE